jgi:hypothetical protein
MIRELRGAFEEFLEGKLMECGGDPQTGVHLFSKTRIAVSLRSRPLDNRRE